MQTVPLWASSEGDRFVDPLGRHLLLRGVNLGGDCKVPCPDGGTETPSDFTDHRDVSFIGRPFPLDEADEHLSRLRHWGFNTLRFLVTWEAVEHAGPGQYDTAYLDYIVAVLERARAHEFFVFIDFHQDVWSRMSGGSGAPGWVFEAVGLNMQAFARSGAALVMQHSFDYASADDHQPSYPMMSWATNYSRPVNGIMWSAFFAGAMLTPDWKISGENIQHYLQRHYLGAMKALAERVHHLPNVIGFDTLNEPGLGWIGKPLSKRPDLPARGQRTFLGPGPVWTPFDGLRLAYGQTVRLPRLARDTGTGELHYAGDRVFNEERLRLWLPGVEDPFAAHGAWRASGDAGGEPLREDFFSRYLGEEINVADQIMAPFFAMVAEAVRELRSDWLIFAELSPYSVAAGARFPRSMPQRWVNASHWYDIECLRTKRAPTLTRTELAEGYRRELLFINALGSKHPSPAPTLIGEFGIQFDLNDGKAYKRWRAGETSPIIWSEHEPLLGAVYDVLDELLASSTQWNYTASNRNDARIGDRWNQEDLSIFSRDQQLDAENLDSGGRALDGFVRAYVVAAQGQLVRQNYDADAARFSFELKADLAIVAPTVLYMPRGRFASIDVAASAPVRWLFDSARQRAEIWATTAGFLRIDVTGSPDFPSASIHPIVDHVTPDRALHAKVAD